MAKRKSANSVKGNAHAVVQADQVGAVHINSVRTGRRPAGRPVESWDPFALQIHRPLEVPGLDEPLPALTGYVRREHDDKLDEDLADLSGSKLIVMVGGSATGKTRALWEAISSHPILRTWLLRYPRTGDELHDLLEADEIAPRTVLWLNEMHNYITRSSGSAVAAKLHALINEDSDVGPVLVVGTLWPEFWERLISEPVSLEDPYSCARLLLESGTLVVVAELFGKESLLALRTDPLVDPRVQIAANTAGAHGAVIQTLVGGPGLVRRFESPATVVDRYAAAVVSVALDARRLGHQQPFKTELLEAVAGTYLSDADRVDVPKDWFEGGLRRAARDQTHGVTALLPCRISDGLPGAADSYELHDYLEQHSWQSRRMMPIEPALWKALDRHTYSSLDKASLGRSASARLIYDIAEPLLTEAAEDGFSGAGYDLVELLTRQGRYEEAFARLRKLVTQGFPEARKRLVDLMVRVDAMDELWQMVHAGDDYAAWRMADVLQQRGDLGALLDLLGKHDGRLWRVRLGEVLAELGRVREAVDVLRVGDSSAHLRLIAILRDHGMADDLANFEHLNDRCVLGDMCVKHAQTQLSELLIERGDLDRLMLLADAAEVPQRRNLALALWKHGYNDEARSLMNAMAEAGDATARHYVADMRIVPRRVSKPALTVPAALYPTERHRRANRLAEQQDLPQLRALSEAGCEYARWRELNLAGELGDTGPLAMAADSGDVRANRRLVEVLSGLGRVYELGRRAWRGDDWASAELGWLASAPGHPAHQAAVSLLKKGLRADGSTRTTDSSGHAGGAIASD
ncbi:hypothetical protein AB0E59_28055 [Lentzea sp. NPDC034063]|uniref:hypothetical protein n=1 Tax=unclassified Lentzea TaxID=2643253 RepID=UPI0034049C7D